MLTVYGYEVDGQLPSIVSLADAREITKTAATDEQLMAGIEQAQALVRAYCGWHVAPLLQCTYETEGNGGLEIQLPATFVDSVQSVTVDANQLSSHTSTAEGS